MRNQSQITERFYKTSGLAALFVDDEIPADRALLEMFLASPMPGVVIPTIGCPSSMLKRGGVVVHGFEAIKNCIKQWPERAKAER